MEFKAIYDSPLGRILLLSDGDALTGLWFEDKAPSLDGELRSSLPLFSDAKRWLDEYFSGKNPDFMPPLSVVGTPFQQKVCRMLLDIPYGETCTYGSLAKRCGGRMSAQAIGGAVGRNPISIIIPCHRVIGGGNNLTGYGGGIERKIRLLELEGVDVTVLQRPKKGKYS